jgi:hypothetical protein
MPCALAVSGSAAARAAAPIKSFNRILLSLIDFTCRLKTHLKPKRSGEGMLEPLVDPAKFT